MFKLRTLRFVLLTTTLAIFVNLALSDVTFAQRGRGRGRFNDKKAGKFINGHDARDGRFDGRGPKFRFGDRRDHGRRFRFRDRWDRDDRFRFRDQRHRDNNWRRHRILRGRRRF